MSVAARPPIVVRRAGTLADIPLQVIRDFSGRRGRWETLYRQHLSVDRARMVLSLPDSRHARSWP